jgi:hypothetical protein
LARGDGEKVVEELLQMLKGLAEESTVKDAV